MTNDEVNPENHSSTRKILVSTIFQQNSLSTKVETSSSDSETKGSLPEVNTEPRSDLHKETIMVTKQNKKNKRKSQKQIRKDRKRSMYSETKKYRLLQTYLLVMNCHGKWEGSKLPWIHNQTYPTRGNTWGRKESGNPTRMKWSKELEVNTNTTIHPWPLTVSKERT